MKPETRLQIDVVDWFEQEYPFVPFTSTQAGDRRNKLAAIMMKRMGYTNGTADLIFFTARGGWHGLLIELKTEKGTWSDDQKVFCNKVSDEEYYYAVAYGIDQAKDEIGKYMLMGKSEQFKQGMSEWMRDDSKKCGSTHRCNNAEGCDDCEFNEEEV